MALDYSVVNPKKAEFRDAPRYDPTDDIILRNRALLEYILETNVYPRETKAVKGLREATEKHAWKFLASTGDGGQFLEFFVKTLNAKNTIELGVFTGYSLLYTALALPEDGKIVAVDMNKDSYNVGLPYLEEAGVAHKIDFREGSCLDVVNTLLTEEKNHGFFDFAFVDADKDNYKNYHEPLMKLVRVGGVIAYDNTLWKGSVSQPDEEVPAKYLHYKPLIRDFNKSLVADSRLDICQLSISDGITLCRRIV